MKYIENSFNLAKTFQDSLKNHCSIFYPEGMNLEIIEKVNENISKSYSFWSDYLDIDLPLIVLLSNEKNYPWLKDNLKKFNFIDAMPKQDRIDSVGNVGVTGGGGAINLEGQDALFFWQVVGTESKYNITGEVKTPPHLFAHSVQTYFSSLKNVKITDLPPWFIEGQSDYSALLCISNTFYEFLIHRNNFVRDCYVPGENRKRLKTMGQYEWYDSLKNGKIPFEGVPLIDEYYSGFFCYEQLINLIGIKNIKVLFNRAINGEDFASVFKDISSVDLDVFLKNVSLIIAEASKDILD